MNVKALHATPRQMSSPDIVRRIAGQLHQALRRDRRSGTTPTPVGASAPVHPTQFTPSIPEPTVQRFIEPRQQVARVDDPFGVMLLIAVRGEISPSSIEQLHQSLADLDRGRFVHLDLGESSIRTSEAMRSLEAIADDLEWRGILLRVVGLDPQHPMLSPTL